MSLSPGARIGSYQITGVIGAGGMGEVYRATDARLGRVVALKALHSLVTGDPERVARFEREAQLLASLNHPNIAAIHGLEEAAGEKYLVLEFIDGRPLSELLQTGALPIAEAIGCARQIADALAAAHERGIIHRDVKPANIMVNGEGVVKVLDFGLGKTIDAPSSPDIANSPTLTVATTQAGIILGTAAYMSPEQAKGRPADKRSDVWAFGCVLYEMFTGRRAFDGEDITETLAAIVRGEPDWSALPPNLPPAIRELVERSLVRNRAERLPDMSVARYLLSERAVHASPPVVPPAAHPAPSAPSRWTMTAAVAIAAVVATASVMRLWDRRQAPLSTSPVRLSIALPEGHALMGMQYAPVAISPDGSTVAYAAVHGGAGQLFIRRLSEPEPRALAGTESARSPFFSPDGQWIGFFMQGALRKIAVSGAGLQTVAGATAAEGRGGTWSRDDTIYFAPSNASGIWKVPAAGGTAMEVTRPDAAKGEISHCWPQVQPDNTTLLFIVRRGPAPDEHEIVSYSLATGLRHTLVPGGDMPRRIATGHLVYSRFDTLLAVPWSVSQTSVDAAVPTTLPENPRLGTEGASVYDVSETGTLVYVAGGPARRKNRLVWQHPSGKTESLPLPEREYESVAISPDGRRAVVQVQEGTVTQWMLDIERRTMTPFFSSSGSSQASVWSHDGARVIYRGTRNGFRNLYWRASDGSGDEERLTDTPGAVQTPTSVSPDGKWVLYSQSGTTAMLFAVPLETPAGSKREPRAILPAGEIGVNGQLSPDGHWMAYTTSVSGRPEVFVRPFPGPGARIQVSTTGALQPKWARDGRTLFFISSAQKVMAAAVTTTGGRFVAGDPRLVSEARYKDQVNSNTAYDLAPDGRLLLVQEGHGESDLTRIDVVLNWFSQLRPAR